MLRFLVCCEQFHVNLLCLFCFNSNSDLSNLFDRYCQNYIYLRKNVFLEIVQHKMNTSFGESGYIYTGAKKYFGQPPMVQVVHLNKMREVCNFHYRHTCAVRWNVVVVLRSVDFKLFICIFL